MSSEPSSRALKYRANNRISKRTTECDLESRITYLDRETAPKGIGLSFRVGTPGPEKELVERFVRECSIPVPKNCEVTVFCEPRLESGFPDLVIVIWDRALTEKWQMQRCALKTSDLRLVQLLRLSGPLSTAQLSEFCVDNLDSALLRLRAADLIVSRKGKWVTRPLSKAFAIKRIIAIEAKISDWGVALTQARLNMWFADQSYVLMPRVPDTETFRASFRSHGIGVIKHGLESRIVARARTRRAASGPRSFAAWQFNEWVWRASITELGST